MNNLDDYLIHEFVFKKRAYVPHYVITLSSWLLSGTGEPTEEAIVITACAATPSPCCPDCQEVSSRIHSIYTRSPKILPSSGRPVRLLQVRRFRCSNPTCRRKTFAEAFPFLAAPCA